jgi:hypothetical protein
MESFSITITGQLPMSSSKVVAVTNEMISSMNLWYIYMTFYSFFATVSRLRPESIKALRVDQQLPPPSPLKM